MDTEGDSRVHFSDVSDPWASSRHVAVLQSLDAVEQVRAARGWLDARLALTPD